MRPALVLLPLALILAAAGAVLALNSTPPSPDLGIKFGQEIHPVTSKMVRETEALARKALPLRKTKTYLGEPVVLAPAKGERPQFLVFIQDGCPCSVDAQPLFNALHKRFGTRIDFVGIIDGDAERARAWAVEKSSRFAIVPDPEKDLIRAYGATSSAYSALVTRQGRLLKMWPGFSVAYLQEMNRLMAKLLGGATQPFDALYAPLEPRTGCAF